MAGPRDIAGPNVPPPQQAQESDAEKAGRLAREKARELGNFSLQAEELAKHKISWPRVRRLGDPKDFVDPRDSKQQAEFVTMPDNAKWPDGDYEFIPDPYDQYKGEQKIGDRIADSLPFAGSLRSRYCVTVENGSMTVYGCRTSKEIYAYYGEIAKQISKTSDTMTIELAHLGEGERRPSNDEMLKKMYIYIDIAQNNKPPLNLEFGPKTKKAMRFLDLSERKGIENALQNLRLQGERTRLLAGASMKFDELTRKINEAKPWDAFVRAGATPADRDTYIREKIYEGKTDAQINNSEKITALEKQLKTIEDEIKQINETQKLVQESLNNYTIMVNDPSKIAELPKVNITRTFREKLWHLWDNKTLNFPTEDSTIEKYNDDLKKPDVLMERIDEINEKSKTDREALITALNNKRDQLEQYRQGIQDEGAKIRRVNDALVDSPEKTRVTTALIEFDKNANARKTAIEAAQRDNTTLKDTHTKLEPRIKESKRIQQQIITGPGGP